MFGRHNWTCGLCIAAFTSSWSTWTMTMGFSKRMYVGRPGSIACVESIWCSRHQLTVFPVLLMLSDHEIYTVCWGLPHLFKSKFEWVACRIGPGIEPSGYHVIYAHVHSAGQRIKAPNNVFSLCVFWTHRNDCLKLAQPPSTWATSHLPSGGLKLRFADKD